MRAPGFVRKVDNLGRVVIPQELRNSLNLEGGDEVELWQENGALILRKFVPGCVFCGGKGHLTTYEGKYICSDCLRNLRKV